MISIRNITIVNTTILEHLRKYYKIEPNTTMNPNTHTIENIQEYRLEIHGNDLKAFRIAPFIDETLFANEQTIFNIHEYTSQYVRTETGINFVLTRMIAFINEPELFAKDIYESKIVECKINNTVVNITKYNPLFIHMYQRLTAIERQAYIHNPERNNNNISQEHPHRGGFRYYPTLGIYVQNLNSPNTLVEIIRIAKMRRETFEIHIKLTTDEVVRFRYL